MTSTANMPTIRTAGTKPVNSRKLFVNVAVADLQRSIDFFEALGFTFNRQFTDDTATCMLVGEDAYFMLLTHDKFMSFSKRPIGDPRVQPVASYAFAVGSRAEVDAIVKAALAAGATTSEEPQDHGFMYQHGFDDLDGHHWEPFWMDPSVVQG